MKLTAAFASLLATLAAAAPTPQEDDPAVVFGISFTYENGTFTDLFDVPETLSGYPVGEPTSIERIPGAEAKRPPADTFDSQQRHRDKRLHISSRQQSRALRVSRARAQQTGSRCGLDHSCDDYRAKSAGRSGLRAMQQNVSHWLGAAPSLPRQGL